MIRLDLADELRLVDLAAALRARPLRILSDPYARRAAYGRAGFADVDPRDDREALRRAALFIRHAAAPVPAAPAAILGAAA